MEREVSGKLSSDMFLRICKISKADLIIQRQQKPSIKKYRLVRLNYYNSYKDRWNSWMKAK